MSGGAWDRSTVANTMRDGETNMTFPLDIIAAADFDFAADEEAFIARFDDLPDDDYIPPATADEIVSAYPGNDCRHGVREEDCATCQAAHDWGTREMVASIAIG